MYLVHAVLYVGHNVDVLIDNIVTMGTALTP